MHLCSRIRAFGASIHKVHVRSVPGAFYKVLTLDGVWGYSPCMGPGVNPVAENGFRAFPIAKMSPQDKQLNTISCIFIPILATFFFQKSN